MKNKLLLGLFSLALIIPLTSCGGSSHSYSEIKEQLETVYRDYGIQVNDLDEQEQTQNNRASRRNLFYDTNKMYERVKSFPESTIKDPAAIQEYYFEALRYSSNPVLIYGELFKENGLGDFLNKVIDDGESYFKIQKNNEQVITLSYSPNTRLQLQFSLSYFDETNYSFECFQYNESIDSPLYVWGNNKKDFLFTAMEKGNTFAFFTTENGQQGFIKEHIEQIDPHYFDIVKPEFEGLKNLNLKDMANHVDQKFTSEEVQDMSERLFPRIKQESEIKYGWYDIGESTYYTTKDNETRVSVPENYKIKKYLYIEDYSHTVKELYIPKSVTMEIDPNSYIVLNYMETGFNAVEKQLNIIIVEEGSETFLNTDFVLYNAEKTIPLAVFANPKGKTLDLNIVHPGHIFIEPSMMQYVENVISCWDGKYDNLLGHINLPIDCEVHVKSWHMNNFPDGGSFTVYANYPIDNLILSGDFEVVEILDFDGQIKHLTLDSSNPNAYVRNQSVLPNYTFNKPMHYKDNEPFKVSQFNVTSEYYFDFETTTCLDLSLFPLWNVYNNAEGGIMHIYLSKAIKKVIASFPTTIGPLDARRNVKRESNKIIIHSQNDLEDGFEYVHDGDERFLLQYPNKDYLVRGYLNFDQYMVELKDGVNYDDNNYNTYKVRAARLDENGKITELLYDVEMYVGMTDGDHYRNIELHVPGGYLGGYNFGNGKTINKYDEVQKEYEEIAYLRTLDGVDPKYVPFFENFKSKIDELFAEYDKYIKMDKTEHNHETLRSILHSIKRIINNVMLVDDLKDVALKAQKYAQEFINSNKCPALYRVATAVLEKCNLNLNSLELHYIGEPEMDIIKCKAYIKMIDYIFEQIGAELNAKVGDNIHFMDDDWDFEMYMSTDFDYNIYIESDYVGAGDAIIAFYKNKLQNM